MFDFLRRRKQPTAEPPPLPFNTYASSDVDGSRHIVVDAAEADLADWRAELIKDDGRVTEMLFEHGMAARKSDGEVSVNPYSSGEMVPAWLLCVEGGRAGAFIGPDGIRYD